MLGGFTSSFVLMLLTLTVGCMPHGTDGTVVAGSADEETVEQRIERKTPPFFIFRSGAGLTTEGPDGG